jgi:sulfonate transport system permease protein
MQDRTLAAAGAEAPPAASPSTTARAKGAGTRRALVFVVPALLLIGWFVATEVTHSFRPNQLPSPLQVLLTARDLLISGDLTKHLVASIGRVALGFAIGSMAALVVATAVGLWRPVEQLLDPTLQAIRSVPSLAWVPFLLLWMGIDEAPKVTLVAIGVFFPVYVNAVSGIRQVDRKLVEVGYVFGLGNLDLVRRIVLPAAAPYLATGLRVGLGQGWLFLVAAELIASTRGLGFMLIDGQNSSRPDIMLVGILALALLGKLSDGALRTVERRVLSWNDTFQGK